MLTYDREYAALSKTPHALADGLMLGFQHPDKEIRLPESSFYFFLLPEVSDSNFGFCGRARCEST
jgi:hypothetical protein